MKKIAAFALLFLINASIHAQKYKYTSDRFLITDALTKEESPWTENTTYIIVDDDVLNIKMAPKFENTFYSIDSVALSTDKNTIMFNAHSGKKSIILHITGWRRGVGMALLVIQGQSKYIKMHISDIE